MCNRTTLVILIPILALIAWKVRETLDIGKEVVFTDGHQSCTAIPAPGGGSEDVTLYKDGVALVSSAPLLPFFHEVKKTDMSKAGIYGLDLTLQEKKPVLLKTTGLPPTIRFAPHGFFYSSRTDKLYVINHGMDKGGDSVLVFNVVAPGEGERFPSLTFYRNVQSDKFPNGVLNDVIEAGEGEIYVTVWLPVALPLEGKHHPADWKEAILTKAADLGGVLPLTHVLRCKFAGKDGKPTCEVAADKFQMANGINTDAQRKQVFVLDVLPMTLNFYTRNSSGLTFSHSLRLPHSGDNVEVDPENGDLYVGTIPIKYISLQAMAMPPNPPNVPGGVTRIRKDGSGQYTLIDDLVVHDGSKLSQVSVGLKYGNGVLLGSPLSPGLLWCEI